MKSNREELINERRELMLRLHELLRRKQHSGGMKYYDADIVNTKLRLKELKDILDSWIIYLIMQQKN